MEHRKIEKAVQEKDNKKCTKVFINSAKAQTINTIAIGTSPEITMSDIASNTVSALAIDHDVQTSTIELIPKLVQSYSPVVPLIAESNAYQIYQISVGNSTNTINFVNSGQAPTFRNPEAEDEMVRIDIQKLCDHFQSEKLLQDDLGLYVPIRGSYTSFFSDPLDLDEIITNFLAGDKKVLLLLGGPGCGKSFWGQILVMQMAKQYQPGTKIPLFISLPMVDNPSQKLIEKVFSQQGISPQGMEMLKKRHSFLFVLDAYDEMHLLKNLYVSNQLDQWRAKIIITCRTSYLTSISNYQQYFMPFNQGKGQMYLLQEVYIAPFLPQQISNYIQQYLKVRHEILKEEMQKDIGLGQELLSAGLYERWINQVPGLDSLIQTPILLSITMEALPSIIKKCYETIYFKINRAKLYDFYVERWFWREEEKLIGLGLHPGKSLYSDYFTFAKILAKKMDEKSVSQIAYEEESNLFDEIFKPNDWAIFFSDNFVPSDKNDIRRRDIRILARKGCPLRKIGSNQYAFLHISLLEYYLTRDLFDQLSLISKVIKVEDNLNQRLLINEKSIIHFLADRVEDGKAFKQRLFDYIYASEGNTNLGNAAANAITILNYAKVSLSNLDFRGVCIKYADLSNAILDDSDLRNADLSFVNFTGASLNNALLNECLMIGVKFGELPHITGSDYAITADGKLYAIAIEQKPLIGSEYTSIFVHESGTEKQICSVKCERWVSKLTFSPNGEMIAACILEKNDRTIHLWNAKNGKLLYKFLPANKKGIDSFCFSPDSQSLVAIKYNGNIVYFWDAIKGTFIKELTISGHVASGIFFGAGDGKTLIAYHPKQAQIATGHYDGAVCIWDVINDNYAKVLEDSKHNINALCYSPDGTQMAVASGGMITFYNTVDWQITHLNRHDNPVVSLCYHPSGDLIAAGGLGTVHIWCAKTGKCLHLFHGHGHWLWVNKLLFHSKIPQLISHDGLHVRFWDLNRQFLKQLTYSHCGEVQSVALHPNQQTVVSAGDKTIRFWQLETGESLGFFIDSYVYTLCLSPDGNYIASGSWYSDTPLNIWNFKTQQLEWRLPVGRSGITAVDFHPQGRQLISVSRCVSQDKTVNVWDIVEKKLIKSLTGSYGKESGCAKYSKKNSLLAVSESTDIQIFNSDNLEFQFTLRGHIKNVISLDFNPAANILVSGSHDNTLRIWELNTQKCLKIINVPQNDMKGGSVETIHFHPNGKYLASAGWDGVIRIWYMQTYQCISTIDECSGDCVYSLQWSQNGESLIAGARDQAVHAWQAIFLEKENKFKFIRKWKTISTLSSINLNINNCKGLEKQQLTLLQQRSRRSKLNEQDITLKGNPSYVTAKLISSYSSIFTKQELQHDAGLALEQSKKLVGPRTGPIINALISNQISNSVLLGTATDNSDCFFDALAQILNKINKTDVNTVKYLRMLCHDFYSKNKTLVDDWNQNDFEGIDKQKDEYYMVQYTSEECKQHFNNRSPIRGRPWVEGIIFCRELALDGILVIEILEDQEINQPVLSYHLVTESAYKNISKEIAQQYLNNPNILILVVEQKSLHFVPLLRVNSDLNNKSEMQVGKVKLQM